MREPKIPSSGPLRVDACRSSAVLACRQVEGLARRLRDGARVLLVAVDHPEAVEAVSAWARRWRAPVEVSATAGRWELRITLLPVAFGEAPLARRSLAPEPAIAGALAA